MGIKWFADVALSPRLWVSYEDETRDSGEGKSCFSHEPTLVQTRYDKADLEYNLIGQIQVKILASWEVT